MSKVVCIIDAYSSGAFLAQHFSERGYELIHIQSSKYLPSFLLESFPIGIFCKTWLNDCLFEELVSQLRSQQPQAVIAGAETGVILAELLANRLGLATNLPELGAARRDKFEMIAAIRRVGLRGTRHLRTDSLKEAIEWIKEFPVVLKPLNSAGSDGVKICYDLDLVARSFQSLLGRANQLGYYNSQVLLEEYLGGIEYMMNAVSCRGEHFITECALSNRIVLDDGAIIYDSLDMIDSERSDYRELQSYFCKVLDALGIQNGPSHGELKIDNRGPVLIEVGARLPGASVPLLSEQCMDYGPITATADAFLNPSQFVQRVRRSKGRHHFFKIVFFISKVSGTVRRTIDTSWIKNLKSYYDIVLDERPGVQIKPTCDLFTTPGYVKLIHENEEVLLRDHELIRMAEYEMFSKAIEADNHGALL